MMTSIKIVITILMLMSIITDAACMSCVYHDFLHNTETHKNPKPVDGQMQIEDEIQPVARMQLNNLQH